ncbi:hypothetical protein [Pantoea endophytica]|nr:hypothetical protein [Pantoea endophytica]
MSGLYIFSGWQHHAIACVIKPSACIAPACGIHGVPRTVLD